MSLTQAGLFLAFSAFSAFSTSVRAYQIPLTSSDASPLTPDFDKLVADTLNHWHVPGISIAVIDGDKTFSKGYGIAVFPDENVTPSTLFYTGSTTKSFTAAAVSLLIDETANSSNPLTWRTPLSSLIREDFVLPDEWATSHVTLEDALSHRTGMPRHDLSYREPNTTVQDAARKLRHLQMTAEPRTRFQYCNMMYITVSHFIETWTGKWLGEVLRERIWKPLGMTSTFFSLSNAEAAVSAGKFSLARGYLWRNRTQEYSGLSHMNNNVISGAGSTISNVLDYTKWLRCMMAMAPPLSPTAHENLRFPRINFRIFEHSGFRGVDGYSLGWMISNYRGESVIWHAGGLPGFATMMAYLPQRQWGFTIMANSGVGGTTAWQILSFRLLDDLIGTPESGRLSWGAVVERDFQKVTETLRNPVKYLYPHAPLDENATPLTFPLGHYAGTYTHSAYGNFTLVIKPNLGANLGSESTKPMEMLHISTYLWNWPLSIDFTHVSGEYFVIHVRPNEDIREPGDYDPMRDSVGKAEMRLSEDGLVKELGLQLEEEMGDDKIWFTRVE